MVANNEEQKLLQKRFLEDGKPFIFIQIRRGETKPKYKSFEKHQITTNEELAQYVFAGFLFKPYVAKDKKNSLFNRDNSSNDYDLNKDYYSVFNYSESQEKKGELFKRSKEEVNELLFVKHLHTKAKKYLKDIYTTKIEAFENTILTTSDVNLKQQTEKSILILKKNRQINNINTFYNISLYYQFKRNFDTLIGAETKIFDYEKFYGKDKSYETDLIKMFADIFTSKTNELIYELGQNDPPKFTRSPSSPTPFFDSLNEKLAVNLSLQEKYTEFVRSFKK
jgi:hypothetical protein